jgi:3-phenylpropionate/cinnamic acid dioxygenase small subunit
VNDVDAITALIHEYAFLLDAGDIDGIVALLAHADIRSTRRDDVRRGEAAIRALFDQVIFYEDGTPRTMHLLTNVTVRLDGTGTASARTYFTVMSVNPNGLHPSLGGEYRDRFVRVDDAWRFTERVYAPKLFGDMSRHMREGDT